LGGNALNQLSPELIAQLYAQESTDPFLPLLELSHPSFAETIRLVNNTVDVVSNGNTYRHYPFRLVLPADDGETVRAVELELDNTSAELIDELRSIVDPVQCKITLVLASDLDTPQIVLDFLELRSIEYDSRNIKAVIVMDDFLNTEVPSERYTPTNFPGIF
jgi:hypothetical protein